MREGMFGRRTRLRGFSALGITLVLATTLMSACGADTSVTAAKQAQALLDTDIKTAQTTYHVPPSMLDPIQTQEAQAAPPSTATDAQYAKATATYKQLDAQVQAILKTTPDQATAQTTKDVTTLTGLVADLHKQGFVEAATFDQLEQQATKPLSSAKTAPEIFAVDTQVQNQIAAVKAFTPTYQALDSFNTRVQSYQSALTVATGSAPQPGPLNCAYEAADSFWSQDQYYTATPQGTGKTNQTLAFLSTYTNWYNTDLKLLRAGRTANDFTQLQQTIAAQQAQLTADQNLGGSSLATYLMKVYSDLVTEYTTDGGTDQTFKQNLTQDQQNLASASAATQAKVLGQIEAHISAIQTPLLKVKTVHDLDNLKKLVADAQSKTTVDPANGTAYPDAYEYADAATGVGDPASRLPNATTPEDFQNLDSEIMMFTTNLNALLKNRTDTTPADQVHQTDVSLMNYYGTTSGHVVVVSLAEQQARFFDNGKLVKSFPVTTGAPDLPSPPGIHCIIYKQTHTMFTSPDPKGSPNWYAPTPINYAMEYSLYGYFLHDAWWRSWFGKYSNLPHYDPAAFNGGSHGCVNLSLTNAAWVYNFVDIGTPVLVY